MAYGQYASSCDPLVIKSSILYKLCNSWLQKTKQKTETLKKSPCLVKYTNIIGVNVSDIMHPHKYWFSIVFTFVWFISCDGVIFVNSKYVMEYTDWAQVTRVQKYMIVYCRARYFCWVNCCSFINEDN